MTRFPLWKHGRRRTAGLVALLLLVAVALVGVAHLAVLPPFEGFDETAHWSYLQELADTGHPPRYGRDGLARDTDRYDGPMPYNGGPPYDATRRPTYRRYRQAEPQKHQETAAAVLRELQERDARDRNRAESPLRPASDATVIDTTNGGRTELLGGLIYPSSTVPSMAFRMSFSP